MPWDYELQQNNHKEMLFRVLNLGTTVAFLGSGCSKEFELPDWKGFVQEVVFLAWRTLRNLTITSEEEHKTHDEQRVTVPKDHKTHYEGRVAEFACRLGMDRMTAEEKYEFSSRTSAESNDFLESLKADARSERNAIQHTEHVSNGAPPPNAPAEVVSKNVPLKNATADEFRFILGACKQICDWCDSKLQETKGNSFLDFLASRFDFEKKKSLIDEALKKPKEVHRNLLALPVHRFITSNYDLFLEVLLSHEHGQPWNNKKFEEFVERNAFTQENRDSEKVARFAAGMSENSRNMVFHCHGWCRKPSSMIVTEEDYQKWYLGEAGGAGPPFRQTMELLFGSHPILFVGFGMNDPDLLMALRTLSATEPERKAQRSLFALMPEFDARDAVERYFEQYGVHVIGYEANKCEPLSPRLAKFLRDLDDEWKDGRARWLLKPKVHDVKVDSKQNPYWHYELESASGPNENIKLTELSISELPTGNKGEKLALTISPTKKTRDLDFLVESFGGKEAKAGRLIVLVGDGGTGKSWFATRLLYRLHNKSMKGFLWSSYYADDALTGIIRANKFFGQEGVQLSRLELFAKCLEEPENVLVFDGLERFLRADKGQPGIGVAANSGVSDFLETLMKLQTGSIKYRATVILTTRLAPELLARKGLNTEFFSVRPMTVEEAVNRAACEKSSFSSEDWAGLVALLGGHRYAMDLAARWPRKQIRHLNHYLGNVGPLRRVERMIELTICRVEQTGEGSCDESKDLGYDKCDGTGQYQMLLNRLAVFMGAIKLETTFKYCHNLAKKEWKKSKWESKEKDQKGGTKENPNGDGFPDPDVMWGRLVADKLLFKVKLDREPNACVMHAVVREFIFHNLHRADARRLASFTQSGFTSGATMVDPGNKGAETVEELFCELRRRCREAYSNWKEPTGNVPLGQVEKAQSLCQEAFGVLRSRMLANTVARWGSYSEYIHYLVRMGDLARAYCGMRQDVHSKLLPRSTKDGRLFWKNCDPALCDDPESLVIHEDGPLFGDELAWLYHELGLALYHQGAMIDCLAVWEQGLEVNRFLDGGQAGQYTFQAYCNLGAACIQYGRLARAREYLETAKEISLLPGNKDEDHLPRLNGYLALIRHLRGDLLLADKEYGAAMEGLAKSGNARAECIFLRHWGDLKLKLKEKRSVEEFIRSSRAKAEEGHFPDLVAQARLSEGHLFRSRKKYQEAIREYEIALGSAKQYGMRGLEADVLSEMARLALDLGDTETARTRAIKSLQIANELHLGLRQTHGLVVLGLATAQAGQRVLGVEYLKQAKELAERQHYELRAREAEKELHLLGAMGSSKAPLQ